jgi:hypothetical protein
MVWRGNRRKLAKSAGPRKEAVLWRTRAARRILNASCVPRPPSLGMHDEKGCGRRSVAFVFPVRVAVATPNIPAIAAAGFTRYRYPKDNAGGLRQTSANAALQPIDCGDDSLPPVGTVLSGKSIALKQSLWMSISTVLRLND